MHTGNKYSEALKAAVKNEKAEVIIMKVLDHAGSSARLRRRPKRTVRRPPPTAMAAGKESMRHMTKDVEADTLCSPR